MAQLSTSRLSERQGGGFFQDDEILVRRNADTLARVLNNVFQCERNDGFRY
jgi:hypothetical protein